MLRSSSKSWYDWCSWKFFFSIHISALITLVPYWRTRWKLPQDMSIMDQWDQGRCDQDVVFSYCWFSWRKMKIYLGGKYNFFCWIWNQSVEFVYFSVLSLLLSFLQFLSTTNIQRGLLLISTNLFSLRWWRYCKLLNECYVSSGDLHTNNKAKICAVWILSPIFVIGAIDLLKDRLFRTCYRKI